MSAVFERVAAALAPAGVDPAFARDVLTGLSSVPQKRIPSTWLYDHRGSQLFEEITTLPEYYPTRTEIGILQRCAAQIAGEAGRGALVVELGSGSSRKTKLLLRALDAPSGYVPIDISAQFLDEAVQGLAREFPALPVWPVVADFTRLSALPVLSRGAAGARRVVFFPGSTIGNFEPEAAVGLLDRIGTAVGRGALLVIGADATQDPAVLIPAYDDAQGVTAAFDKNLLARINRELEGDFSLSAFRHEARWDPQQHRVEMHLVSEYSQRVRVLGHGFRFAAGESIHTENSYKHGIVRFQALARRAGWAQKQLWMDAQARFALHVLERAR